MKQQSDEKLHTRSRKVAILFTDIKGSTTIWEKQGDHEARQLVEKHNRLLFPIVKKYKGKIVKTIGDAIMAKFKSPYRAVKAGIAMQQVLNEERARGDFPIRVRIGIHYGEGLVESKDVYGDLVNAAARIEGKAKADQVLISGAVEREIRKKKDISYTKAKSFVPKGKSKSIPLYSCDWKKSQSVLHERGIRHALPVGPAQAYRLAFYLFVVLMGTFALFQRYARFLIADSEQGAAMILSFQRLVLANIFSIVGGAGIGIFIIWGALRKGLTPLGIIRLLKGTLVGMITTAVILLGIHFLPESVPFKVKSAEPIYESKHLFVKVVADNVNIRKRAPRGDVIQQASKGDIYLLSDTILRKGVVYNQVWLGEGEQGYVARVLPPKLGVPEKRLTYTDKFYFTLGDLVALVAGAITFLWGALAFKIRPL